MIRNRGFIFMLIWKNISVSQCQRFVIQYFDCHLMEIHANNIRRGALRKKQKTPIAVPELFKLFRNPHFNKIWTFFFFDLWSLNKVYAFVSGIYMYLSSLYSKIRFFIPAEILWLQTINGRACLDALKYAGLWFCVIMQPFKFPHLVSFRGTDSSTMSCLYTIDII